MTPDMEFVQTSGSSFEPILAGATPGFQQESSYLPANAFSVPADAPDFLKQERELQANNYYENLNKKRKRKKRALLSGQVEVNPMDTTVLIDNLVADTNYRFSIKAVSYEEESKGLSQIVATPKNFCLSSPDICQGGPGQCYSNYLSAICKCPKGYAGDGINECLDIDECSQERTPCNPEKSYCVNTDGSYECNCKPGFEKVNGHCVDINECLTKNCPVEHANDVNRKCLNTFGSYKCICDLGLMEDETTKQCIDINECVENDPPVVCAANAHCENSFSSHNCVCDSGYRGNGRLKCEDIDECMDNLHNCANADECQNIPGGYECDCAVGYTKHPVTSECVDLDECESLEAQKFCLTQGSHVTCQNNVGSFTCECQEGFNRNRWSASNECVDINECMMPGMCSTDSTCVNTLGSYTCQCPEGQELITNTVTDEKMCSDIDECLTASCPGISVCVNLPGGYECQCPTGFEGNGHLGICNDIDECSVDFNICARSAAADASLTGSSFKAGHGICVNTHGSYKCQCANGFESRVDPLSGKTKCQDIDECADGQGEIYCKIKNSYCHNFDGGFDCRCQKGYIGDANIACVDEDECHDNTHQCDSRATCKNNIGGYDCECMVGYSSVMLSQGTSQQKHVCIDKNECTEGTHNCNSNAKCQNTEGGFSCNCQLGYHGNGTICMDIDECANNSHNCHPTMAYCANIPGSFRCTCKPGYRGDGNYCVDIDECALGNHGCPMESSNCENTSGSYRCACHEGYSGDDCSDINECLSDAQICKDVNMQCKNTMGSYECNCKEGYELIDGVCLDIDECQILSSCHRYATCTNTEGGFQCKCKPGYLGDGKRCGLYNVCEAGLHDCHDYAVCSTPEIGEYVCTCPGGFLGDGLNCVDINECELAIHSCTDEEECVNTIGSFQCVCPEGFRRDDDTDSCVDIDECRDLDYEICGEFGNCINNVGSFECTCPRGFSKLNETVCEDIDECSQTVAKQIKQGNRMIWRKFTKCGQSSFCTNTPGSFACECFNGFERHQNGTCIDIDECQRNQNLCDRNAKCRNLAGSYECVCNLGYGGTGEKCLQSRCQPAQRLARGLEYKECFFGRCTLGCKEGYIRNMTAGGTEHVTCSTKGKFNQTPMRCSRVDPCGENGNNNCDSFYGTCTTLAETFKCSCPTGFQLVHQVLDALPGTKPESIQKCVDINECHMKPSKCHVNADCINELGGYSCKCKPGYFGNGNTCTELNECLQRNVCPRTAFCINLKGSFKCKCRPGWTMYENTCVRDSSTELCKTLDCGVEQRCIVNPNSNRPKCVCPIGTRAYNRRCLPINECEQTNNVCPENSSCLDKDKGYSCKCNEGFYKNMNNTCTASSACLVNPCDVETENCIGLNQRETKCVCKEGYMKNLFGKCQDVDECSDLVPIEHGHQCPGNAECVNIPGSYKCTCPAGYLMQNGKCEDINECHDTTTKKCPISSKCVNTIGSYECSCNKGYELNLEFNRCMDIDECQTDENGCHENAYCSNIPGSYICTCNAGFSGTGLGEISTNGCIDVNECLSTTLNDCHSNAVCINNHGSYTCKCRFGYFGDGIDSCIEDVCVTMPGEICHSAATCIPLDRTMILAQTQHSQMQSLRPGITTHSMWGSHSPVSMTSPISDDNITPDTYRCECKSGYKGDGKNSCIDINECLENLKPCGENTICINTQGSYTCQCRTNYVNRSGASLKVGKCTLNECANPSLNDCAADSICTDTEAGFECKCKDGFSGNGKICTEVNECSGAMNVCVENAECVDKIGGINCVCKKGYTGDGYSKCSDLNECSDQVNPACPGENTLCTNSVGSFSCSCQPGFKYSNSLPSKQCIDINECATSTDNCHADAVCTNNSGSFTCQCKDGFTGNGNICNDINECAAPVSPCTNPAQKCINLPGSYQCGCPEGHSGPDPITNKCTDIDECEDPKACHNLATCENTIGAYKCTCKPGFMGNGKTWCGDINECNKPNACPGISKCTNTVGSFKCACPPGYRGQAHNCQDINECNATGANAKCPAPATCKNLPGKFQCMCPTGFTWSESQNKCLDIDECEWMQTKPWNPPCDKLAGICTNNEGGYDCKCKKGFRGDGKECLDIDECEKETSCPGKNNLCINEPGTFTCRQLTCPPSVFADVALVVDTHTQIGPYNLKFVQEFSKAIVDQLEVASNGTYLSITAYSGEKVTPLYFLSDTAIRGKEVALQAVSRIKHVGYGIRIEKALSFLLNFSFLPAMGRRTDKKGIAILLASQKTDSQQALKFLEPALRKAEKPYSEGGKDLTFLAVGVKDAVEDELMMVTGQNKDNVIMAGDWKDLPKAVPKVMEALCDITGFNDE